MITLFTIPKAFTGGDKIRQENALGSWTRLDPRPEIILFCDDPGVAEAAKQFDCIHVPDIKRNEDGIPFVGEAFRLASQMASNNILCYANADIIFIQDFIVAVRTVAQNFNEPFLIVGQRRDIGSTEVTEPLEFVDGWQQRLKHQARKHGTLHSTSAIDYFVYTRGSIEHLPAFLVGSPKWDNWTVADAEKRGLQVVSATGAITCIHQRHPHVWPSKGAHYNHRVWRKAGGGVGHWARGSTGKLGGKPTREPWVPPGLETWSIPSSTRAARLSHKPKSKPRRTRSPRPARVVPKDELGLPINLNISARELASSARKLRQAKVRTPGHKRKHSHSAPPERELQLKERARLKQIKDTILAARIAARDARLARRKKKRP